METNDISRPFLKASTALTGATVASTDAASQVARAATADSSYQTWMAINSIPWDSIAKISAALYGVAVLSEWLWKKLLRPLAERRGWIKPKTRLTAREWAQRADSEESDRAPL